MRSQWELLLGYTAPRMVFHRSICRGVFPGSVQISNRKKNQKSVFLALCSLLQYTYKYMDSQIQFIYCDL